MDIARLGIEIDSRPVAKAREELGQFSTGAKQAETATNGLSAAFRTGAASTNQFGRAVEQTAQTAERASSRISLAMTAAQSVTGGLVGALSSVFRAGPLVALASAGGVLAAVNTMKNELLELEAISKRTGMTVNQVNGMNLLGARNGVGQEVIGKGLEGLSERLAEAARGEGELGKLFELNNIRLRDRNGQVISTNAALERAAELMRNAASESDKIKIAELLGLSREWIPILERGSEAFRKARDEANQAAGAIDRELIAKAQEFDRQWNKAWADWTAWGKSRILDVAGELSRLWTMATNMSWGPGTGVLRDSDLRPGETRGQPRGTLRDSSTDDIVARLTREQAIRSGAPLTGGTTRLPGSDRGGGGGGGEGTDTPQKRLDAYIDSLARQDAVMRSQIETFGQSNAVRKAAEEIARAQVDLNRLDAETRGDVVRRLTEQVQSSEALRSKLEELQRAQALAVDMNNTFRDGVKGLFSETASAVQNGANVFEAFGQSALRQLNRISDRLMQMAIDQLWLKAFGGSGGLFGSGGLLGGIFGGGGGDISGIHEIAHGFASGGLVRGPGTDRSDSILARLSNNEFVVNARSTAMHLPLLHAINQGVVPAFAEGGLVRPSFPGVHGGEMILERRR